MGVTLFLFYFRMLVASCSIEAIFFILKGLIEKLFFGLIGTYLRYGL
jgi:hypothetical protein